MIATIIIGIALALSIGVNALLFILYQRAQRDWMEMFRRREGLELPEEMEQAQNADVVRTAKDLVARQSMKRRRTPAFSIPVPGTEWMQRGKEQ